VDEPPLPPPPPKTNLKLLWTSLLVPPAVTAGSNLLIGCCGEVGSYGENMLLSLLVAVLTIFACLFVFLAAIRPRFRGRSAVLLGFAFPVGHIVVCLAVWFGSCIPFLR
jgi:hypothetical protein